MMPQKRIHLLYFRVNPTDLNIYIVFLMGELNLFYHSKELINRHKLKVIAGFKIETCYRKIKRLLLDQIDKV